MVLKYPVKVKSPVTFVSNLVAPVLPSLHHEKIYQVAGTAVTEVPLLPDATVCTLVPLIVPHAPVRYVTVKLLPHHHDSVKYPVYV